MKRIIRTFCTKTANVQKFDVVVAGGGSGGASVSNRLGRKLGSSHVAVVEPDETHFYQGLWTMVGAGMRQFPMSARPASKILTNSVWLKTGVADFDPENNIVVLQNGQRLEYKVLIVALGLQLRYELIKGLPEAFEAPGVCSNYHREYVKKTFPSLQNFRGGNALFTFPHTSIKCPGAPQKIMYLAEEYFRMQNVRDKTTVYYCTPTNFMFGVKAYNAPLEQICDKRKIIRLYRHTLTEVKPSTNEAFFDIKDDNGKLIDQKALKYDMIHVGPPCSAPEVLRRQKSLVDATGYLDVDKHNLQHTKFKNIFGIGDCTNLPTSKTAAAAASESRVVHENVVLFLENRPLTGSYNGYASCPMLTGYKTAIMPEFDYTLTPLETLPIDQSKERLIFYYMKAYLMPLLYWQGLVKGIWNGPGVIRKILHFGKGR